MIGALSIKKVDGYVGLLRAFTLVAPAVGIISGAAVAVGAHPRLAPSLTDMAAIAVAALMASTLNGASNVLNQICDVQIDRINKPARPLPSGHVTARAATAFAALLYGASLLLAAAVNVRCLAIAAVAALLTCVYSLPPMRTKKRGAMGNLTIALARGLLLPVCGWAVLRPVSSIEPWIVGGVLGLYIFGASATKDFDDVEGDRAFGCKTLVVRYGATRCAQIVAPFFVVPFAAMSVASLLGWLSGSGAVLASGGLALAIWGAWVSWGIVRDARKSRTLGRTWWRQMYLILMGAQIVFAAAYVV